MGPVMCSEMNPYILSQSNDRRRFTTDVSILALAVAIPFLLRLHCGPTTVRWKSIYVWGISIIIQLHVAEESLEGTYKAV